MAAAEAPPQIAVVERDGLVEPVDVRIGVEEPVLAARQHHQRLPVQLPQWSVYGDSVPQIQGVNGAEFEVEIQLLAVARVQAHEHALRRRFHPHSFPYLHLCSRPESSHCKLQYCCLHYART
uniref:Uncharacterized protein n=1 Tax=Rhodococcus hoagii TaxID=43767 RepID=A0A1Z1UWZ6_RHOHA|nr:hypothetical protein pVAPB1475_0841 [Prescottella equi]